MENLSGNGISKCAESPKKTEDNHNLSDEKKVMEDGELHEDDLDSNKGDEEDVPDDFFDDFSNQDFMDGLDIVDAWDEREKSKQLKQDKKEAKRKEKKRSKERKVRSAEGDKRKRSEDRKRRSRSKERKHRDTSPHTANKKRNVDDSDLRRDPNKTKRDLERDRENYAKKKEQKLISKVVETGLVPPGMESEVNLNEIESTTEKMPDHKVKEKTKKDSDEFKSNREKRSRDRSREKRRKRSRSFERQTSFFRERSRGKSTDKRRERRERSRDRVRRTHSRDKSLDRIHSSFSPQHWRRRSRSISDRERWLHLRRSPSPERKYQGRIIEEKMSFLEEIKMKLDGMPTSNSPVTYPHPQATIQKYVPPGPNPYSTPAMHTGHQSMNQYYPPAQNSPYDQNFFIGEPEPVPPINHTPLNGTQMVPGGQQIGVMPSMTDFTAHHSNRFPVGPVPAPNCSMLTPVSITGVNHVSKLMEQIRATTNSKICQAETAAQLLEEKKLSLTDFLSINSRLPAFSSSTPDALQKKVSVLSRCQDVLKELTGDKKFSGKLVVTKCSKRQTNPQVKNVSPLLRKEPVRFSFSTSAKNSDKKTFQTLLNKALIRAKVITEVIDLDDCESSIDADVPPPPPVIVKSKIPFGVASKIADTSVNKKMLMKMCQTDPLHCEECEKRKFVKSRSIGVQCGETERYNVGVQVTESDIIHSKIPKNQSLAYLTPAQLLGRSEPTSTKIDHFGKPYGRSEHPPVFREPPEYREWGRLCDDIDPRRDDYMNPSYSGGVMRDRFPRY